MEELDVKRGMISILIAAAFLAMAIGFIYEVDRERREVAKEEALAYQRSEVITGKVRMITYSNLYNGAMLTLQTEAKHLREIYLEDKIPTEISGNIQVRIIPASKYSEKRVEIQSL